MLALRLINPFIITLAKIIIQLLKGYMAFEIMKFS